MTTKALATTTGNRLAKSEVQSGGSALTAAEYAMRAEDAGDKIKAKLWWDAHKDGWDARNYDPEAAARHWDKISDNRKGWAGGKLRGLAPHYGGPVRDPSEAHQ